GPAPASDSERLWHPVPIRARWLLCDKRRFWGAADRQEAFRRSEVFAQPFPKYPNGLLCSLAPLDRAPTPLFLVECCDSRGNTAESHSSPWARSCLSQMAGRQADRQPVVLKGSRQSIPRRDNSTRFEPFDLILAEKRLRVNPGCGAFVAPHV